MTHGKAEKCLGCLAGEVAPTSPKAQSLIAKTAKAKEPIPTRSMKCPLALRPHLSYKTGMAKLSAYGRVEVSTFIKREALTNQPERRTKLRLMSDGQILIKVDTKFSDGSPMSFPWKKWAKMKHWTTPEVDSDGYKEKVEEFKAIATKRGFVEE